MFSIRTVELLGGYRVALTFEDGLKRVVDLEPFLWGPVFDEIRINPVLFREVRIQDHTIGWPNGADIAPDTLYYGLGPTPNPHRPANR